MWGWRPTFGRRPVSAKGRPMLGKLWALLAIEHDCTPPDSSTDWYCVPEDAAERLGPSDIYVCPFCNQHMARLRERSASQIVASQT